MTLSYGSDVLIFQWCTLKKCQHNKRPERKILFFCLNFASAITVRIHLYVVCTYNFNWTIRLFTHIILHATCAAISRQTYGFTMSKVIRRHKLLKYFSCLSSPTSFKCMLDSVLFSNWSLQVFTLPMFQMWTVAFLPTDFIDTRQIVLNSFIVRVDNYT